MHKNRLSILHKLILTNLITKPTPQFILGRGILIFGLGLSLGLAFPPHALQAVIVLNMLIFIYGLEKNFLRSAFIYGYIFYLGAGIVFIGSWFSYYFRLQLESSYFVSYLLTLVLCLYAAIYIGVICALYKWLKLPHKLFNLTLLFPSLWTLTELLRGTFFPRSWYAFGYTQVTNPLFRGYFPLLGVYFVSWLILAISGWCVYCILNHNHKKWLKLTTGLAIFSLISFGLAQIKYTHPIGKPLRIALLQPNIFSTKNYTPLTLLSLEHAAQSLVTKTNADILILPETMFGTTYEYLTPGFLDSLQHIVQAKNASLIFGTSLEGPNNELYTGDVNIEELNHPIYLKHNLVPFGEYNPLKNTSLAWMLGTTAAQITEYTAGESNSLPANIKGQKFAFNICYENTINDFVAQNARSASILLNQSDLSWYGKTNMKDAFFQFSQARALENQRYFLQDGTTGDTAIINQNGAVEVQIPPYIAGAASGMVQGYTGLTPFQILGNWPIWLWSILVILVAVIRKTHSARTILISSRLSNSVLNYIKNKPQN